MSESRRANLLSRLFSLPAANSVAHELDETLEEARAFLRHGTPRTNAGQNQDAVDEEGGEVPEADPQEISLDFDFDSLTQLPWARAASLFGPFVALLLLKLIYEVVPFVLSLVVLTAAHEWLYTSFHSQVELMKSRRPNARWIGTLLNLALTVALAAFIFVDSATGLNGLADSLFFINLEVVQATTSMSVITCLWALLLVNAISSLYVLIAKMFVCLCVLLFDHVSGREGSDEVSSHRDDETESRFFDRYEKASTAIKVMGHVGLIYRSLLPAIFWAAFYGNSRFAAATLQAFYLLAKVVEIGMKMYAVGTVLKRLLWQGGTGTLGVLLSASEITEQGEVDKQCPICFEALDAGRSPVRLESCGHVYCRKCIGMWAQDKKNATCAVCRAPIRVSEEDQNVDQYCADLAFHNNRWMPILL